jgi:hypothetical protein
MATGTAWVYVINDGSGPQIRRTSHDGITVIMNQPGNYTVTLPFAVSGLAAVATLANSVGTITAVPGENTGLAPNQISVSTLTLQNQLSPALDFSLAAFYRVRWPWWPWLVAGLAAVALYALVGR